MTLDRLKKKKTLLCICTLPGPSLLFSEVELLLFIITHTQSFLLPALRTELIIKAMHA